VGAQAHRLPKVAPPLLAMTLLDKVKLVFLHLIGTVVENKVTRRWAFRQSRQTYIVSSIYFVIIFTVKHFK